MSTSIDYFDYIRISIASPERILKWSYGEGSAKGFLDLLKTGNAIAVNIKE